MKKWSYAAAMMLAISSGCIFTGCIDNDEPYGIEQIRVATADLLKSKKAAVEAEAAAANNALEMAKIQAEIDKIKAENEKIAAEAAAKYQEALGQAELLRAQADAALTEAQAAEYNARAEEALARAENQKAQTEVMIKDRQADIDRKIASLEADMKAWDLQYEKDLYNWEEHKANQIAVANQNLWNQVELAFTIYLGKLQAYNDANWNYLNALKKYNEYNLDLKWDENEKEFISTKYSQKEYLLGEVKAATNEVAKYQKQISEYDEMLTKLDGIKTSELGTLLDEYQGKLAAAKEATVLAQAAWDKVKYDNSEVTDLPGKLAQEIRELMSEDIKIPAYTYDPKEHPVLEEINPLGASFQTNDKITVVPENEKYTLNQQQSSSPSAPSAYDQAKSNYEGLRDALNDLLLDANDEAWTQAKLTELKRVLPELAKNVTKGWVNAVAVYNDGDIPAIDKAFKGAALNATIQPLIDAQTALVPLKGKLVEAEIAFNDAEDKLNQAVNAEATVLADPDATDADKAAATTAKTEAQRVYNEKLEAYGPVGMPRGKGARGATKAFDDAADKVQNALDAFNQAIQDQLQEIRSAIGNSFTWGKDANPRLDGNITKLTVIQRAPDGTLLEDQFVDVTTPVAPLAYCNANKQYVNVTEYLSEASQYTFGNLGQDYDDPDITQDTEILVKMDFDNPLKDVTGILAFFNDYLVKSTPTLKPWEFKAQYAGTFGQYGKKVLGELYTYNVGTLCVNDGPLPAAVKDVIDNEIDPKLTALVDSFNEQTDKVKALEEQKEAAQEAADNVGEDEKNAYMAAGQYEGFISGMINVLQAGIDSLAKDEAPDVTTTVGDETKNVDTLKGLIEYFENAKETSEISLDNANEWLAKAQYQLDQYNSDAAQAIPSDASLEADYFNSLLDIAKQNLDFWKTRYQSLEEQYNSATSKE